MSIKEQLDQYTAYVGQAETDLENIKSKLTEKKVQVPEGTKLSGIPALIDSVKTGNELKINVSADDYEGKTFTATHEDRETVVTTKISQQKGTLVVPKSGTYTVTNEVDEQSKEATLVDSVDLSFIKFKATIKVTVASELVGETITCTLASDTLEKKADSTTVIFTVEKHGNWKVAVKGNTYITATVNVQNAQQYTASLTIANAPTITVKSKEEDNGKTIKCTKSGKVLTKVLKNKECLFILPETGSWTVTCDDYPEISKVVNVSSATAYYCSLRSTVFGIKITETESDSEKRVTYTDDAIGSSPVKVDQSSGSATYNNWDKTWIFEKIYPAMVKTNGTIDYKLNPNDYSKKAAGGSSDITSTSYGGNAMVVVEKFYTKFGMSGSDETIQISDEKEDGFEAIGFIREDGSEADYVCLPMFMGSFDSSSKLRSLSGQTIKYSTSFTDFRTAAQKNGSTYDIETWAMNQMFQAVYYILMKNCNIGTAIGQGRDYNGGSSKTGLMNSKGPIAYDPTTKAVKFMHVEDFSSTNSSGLYRWEAGILATNGEIYVKMKPSYSGTATSGYEKVPDFVTTNSSGKYISKMKCSNKYGRYPIGYEGAATTYESSRWYDYKSSQISVSLRGTLFGVAGRNFNGTASDAYYALGAALSLIPPA